MAKRGSKTPDFEGLLKELEDIVDKMEKGDLSLDESLQSFEQGIKLTRTCQQAIKDAEQKVDVLMQKDGDNALQPFDTPPE
ncbi:MAG: exodeoxyribonuclease VII small subunit [Gammaproteobacteria bacterium]